MRAGLGIADLRACPASWARGQRAYLGKAPADRGAGVYLTALGRIRHESVTPRLVI